MTLKKYNESGKDYLIFDPAQNSQPLTTDILRSLCFRNFGVTSSAILVGPLSENKLYKILDFNGKEVSADDCSSVVFDKYLNDFPPASTIYYFPS